MKLKLTKHYCAISIVDEDEKVEERDWHGRPYSVDKRVARVSFSQMPHCCGICSIGGFEFGKWSRSAESYLLEEKYFDAYKMIADALIPVVKKSRFTCAYITFFRHSNKPEFYHQPLMDELLKQGWKKLGPEFTNLRYKKRKRQHHLQTLVYLIQPNVEGNAHV